MAKFIDATTVEETTATCRPTCAGKLQDVAGTIEHPKLSYMVMRFPVLSIQLNSTQLVPVDNIDIVGRRVSRDPYPRA